jgi:rhodanese-related sulfurtransferase
MSSTPPPGWTAIKPEELKQKIESKADILIIDVRTKEQYAQGHVKGAISLPSGDLEQQYKNVVPHDKEVVLYCDGGT